MAPIKTLMGKWRGGPNNNMITIVKDKEGKLVGEFAGAKGGPAGIYGACLKHGAELRGFWFDVDAGVSAGLRMSCTIVVSIDMQADPSGNTAVGRYKTKDGGEGTWEAKRFEADKEVKRSEGKISEFTFKDKTRFDTLTANMWEARKEKLEKEAAEILATTAARPFFDGMGATGYVPGPGVGAEYMSGPELERHLRKMDEQHMKDLTQAYEDELARVSESLEKGTAKDADKAKKRKETLEMFIRSFKSGEKLKERPKFKPTPAPFSRKPERAGDHVKDPYVNQFELGQLLKRLTIEHEAKTAERLEAEIASLDAFVAKGEGNVDQAKSRMEMCKRLLAGAKGAEKLKERPQMKPPSGTIRIKVEPREPKPEPYYSAFELGQKLAHDEEKWNQTYPERLEFEIKRSEALAAKGENADANTARAAMLKRLIEGTKSSAKLAERKKFKSKPAMPNVKCSPTIMLHPINVHSMLKSMGR